MAIKMNSSTRIAVVIPCYRVRDFILDVITGIGEEVSTIYIVDDKCPQQTGVYVKENCNDLRVHVLFHEKNKGVGGAVVTGYLRALKDGADITVKVDGDGQMDTSLIPMFVNPIVKRHADYTKGNRFFDIDSLHSMPWLRLFGNAVLSFVNKITSGYWSTMDPTNGFTAIHSTVLSRLPLNKLDNRYFFESDMLFRLNTVRAVVLDIPMKSCYKNEESSLSIKKVVVEFPFKYMNRLLKRIAYSYFLRDFSIASVELVASILLIAFGTVFGVQSWLESLQTNIYSSSGTVMLAALPILLGVQLLLSFINYDINNQPKFPLSTLLSSKK